MTDEILDRRSTAAITRPGIPPDRHVKAGWITSVEEPTVMTGPEAEAATERRDQHFDWLAEALGIAPDCAVVERGTRAVVGEHLENSGPVLAADTIAYRARAAQQRARSVVLAVGAGSTPAQAETGPGPSRGHPAAADQRTGRTGARRPSRWPDTGRDELWPG